MTTITRRLGTTVLPGRPWPPTRPLAPRPHGCRRSPGSAGVVASPVRSVSGSPGRQSAGVVRRGGQVAGQLASHTQTEAEGAAAKSSPSRSGQHLAAVGAVRRHRFTPSTRPGLRAEVTPGRGAQVACGSCMFCSVGPTAIDLQCWLLPRGGASRNRKEDVHARIHGTRHGEEWVTSKNGSRPCPPEFPMALRLHLPHRTTAGSAPSQEPPHLGTRVYAVQRAGAVLVALFLLVFALLGFASGQKFFSIQGQPVLGMSSNGLLSTISVVVALVLLAAAARGPRTASTVMIVLGPLFLLSAFVNAIVLETRLNWLAFSISNVVFSIVVGLVLLLLCVYGRIGGHLPPDSPYAHTATDEASYVHERPSPQEKVAAETAMREAAPAVVQHTAAAGQHPSVHAMTIIRTRAQARRLWMEFD